MCIYLVVMWCLRSILFLRIHQELMITLLVRLYEQYPWKCFFDTYLSSSFLERNIFLLFFNWILLSSSTSYKSYDPGAAIVIEGVFCISNPFPINWFTDRYKAKIYVIQVKWSFTLTDYSIPN